jgi:hypothetical protein
MLRIFLLGTVFTLLNWSASLAVTRTSTLSGNWSAAATWNPAGVPTASDSLIVNGGHAINMDAAGSSYASALNILAGGTLSWPANSSNKLNIGGSLTVNGTLDMDGDIGIAPGKSVTVGATGSLIWNPWTNTGSGATLFTNGIENFHATSTLTIVKWYDFTVPLGSVVSSNFGNLILNSVRSGNTIVEWNQNNLFQTRIIQGTLTVADAWITLDKSGSISSTSIGNIILNSPNSVLYGLYGNHTGSFTLNTGSIMNNGGTFIALMDGTGNITLNVNGNLTTSGNFKLINNSGIANVCNGNAALTVNGTMSQSAGDCRFIYNVSTLNSGIFTATITNMTYTGGIFHGLFGVHPSSGLCTLNILNNLSLNAPTSGNSDIFRCIGLSSISSTFNTARLQFTVGNNFTINGNSNSEFISSASRGNETVAITGNFSVSNGLNSFNYSTNTASAHSNTLSIAGSYSQNGGTVHFSRLGGTHSLQVTGNFTFSAGTLSLKSSTGISNGNIDGNMLVSGGTIYLHNNATEVTADPCQLSVNGSFTHSNGTINFDDNLSNASAQHRLILKGPTCTLSGAAVMTHAGAGSCTTFGMLSFNRLGTINYTRASSHALQQIKQRVEAACTLKVVSGSIQVATHALAALDYFRIATDGRVELGTNQFLSNANFANTGMQVDSSASLAIGRTNGLYDGTLNGSISSNSNMNFLLHEYSTVEYYASTSQNITGTGVGLATGTQHQYGILKIALQGATTTNASPTGSNVFVRRSLQLDQGELFLNIYPITILNGEPNGINRLNGYVKSEMNSGNNTAVINWQNIQSNDHVFPFGKNASTYLPVTFRPLNNYGGTVSISTRATTSSDNLPMGGIALLKGVSSINNAPANAPHAIMDVVDRWWQINAPAGMSANLTLTYAGAENSLPDKTYDPMSIYSWPSAEWISSTYFANGITGNTGSVSAYGTSNFGQLVVASSSITLPIQLLSFEATKKDNHVELNWITSVEINNDYFTVERSRDGVNFEPIKEVSGAGNSNKNITYTTNDDSPYSGTSCYRIMQTDFDGKFTYSETRYVNFLEKQSTALNITEMGPNPFNSNFHFVVNGGDSGPLQVQLTDMTGKIIYTKTEVKETPQTLIEVNGLPELPAGNYLLMVNGRSTSATKRIIRN